MNLLTSFSVLFFGRIQPSSGWTMDNIIIVVIQKIQKIANDIHIIDHSATSSGKSIESFVSLLGSSHSVAQKTNSFLIRSPYPPFWKVKKKLLPATMHSSVLWCEQLLMLQSLCKDQVSLCLQKCLVVATSLPRKRTVSKPLVCFCSQQHVVVCSCSRSERSFP